MTSLTKELTSDQNLISENHSTDNSTGTISKGGKRKKTEIEEETGIELQDLPLSFSKMYDIPEIRQKIYEYTVIKRCEGFSFFIDKTRESCFH
jgi:hypothetical protein